jgi:two-component system cell cycle sensor histidine kinase/response regulator CckA
VSGVEIDYASFFDERGFALFVATLDGELLDANDALVGLLRHSSRSSLLGLRLQDLVRQEDVVAWNALAVSAADGTIDARMRRSDGSAAWVSMVVRCRHAEHGLLCTAAVIDLTELRDAQDAYRTLVDTSPIGLVVIQEEGIVLSNPAHDRMVGAPQTGVPLERSIPASVHPDDQSRIIDRIRDRLAGKDPPAHGVHRYLVDGKTRWVEVWSYRIEHKGRPALHAFSLDITERVMATEAARASEERFRTLAERFESLLEAAPDAMVLIDSDRRIVLVNAQAEEMFGYTRSELVECAIDRLIPEVGAVMTDSLDLGGPGARLAEQGRALRALRRDGTELPVQVSLSPVETVGSRFLFAAIRDVTTVRELEAKLFQAQKTEAIGRLAGGIAHDFNNILSVILSYCHLILRRLPEPDRTRSEVREIESAGLRAAELTSQLLAFSRKQVLAPRIVELNRFIEETETLLGRLVGEDIELVTLLGSSPLWIRVDHGLLAQVLMNLVVNARDAMPRGGRLIVETGRIDASGAPPRVQLRVTDTGVGMEPELRARIFEPYFTTKGVGKGTGLGLATVLGIVEQSGGSVAVDSAPGRGTTFDVQFPTAPVGASSADSQEPRRSAPASGERILLVEDEVPVRRAIAAMLEVLGYRPIAAESAEDALDIARSYEGNIDLLLTDVVMPRIGGPELARRFLALRPRAKVLYTSGYTEDAMLRQGVATADIAFMAKPVTADALAQRIRDLLDGE